MPMIAYRQSMHKYDGGPTCLELNNCNFPPAPARLNVQLLALLLTLRIPIAVFERLVQDQLDLIGSITTNREIAFMYVKGELDAAADNDYAQSCEYLVGTTLFKNIKLIPRLPQYTPCFWHSMIFRNRKSGRHCSDSRGVNMRACGRRCPSGSLTPAICLA